MVVFHCYFIRLSPPPRSTETDKMLDALRDLRVKHLENCKAKTAEAFQELYNTVKDQASESEIASPPAACCR